MARTILVPLDATPESAAVLDTVRELARVEGATVRLLHVASPPEAVVNDEGQVIADADQETDGVVELVAMATHRRKGAARLIAGSVAETVERQTTRPVLLVCYGHAGGSEVAA